MSVRPAALMLTLLTASPTLAGEFTRRFELTLDRVLDGGPPRYDLPFLLADLRPTPTRRFTEFSGDLSGRWIGATAWAATRRPESRDRLRALLREAAALRRSDGGFGDPLSNSRATEDDMARLWGHGRLLIGLAEAYNRDPRPETLRAVRETADFLVALVPRFNAAAVRREFRDGKLANGYVCWTQNIEGLVAAYRLSRESDPAAAGSYLEAARAIADGVERRPGQHSHGYLTSLRGLLDLYEATGRRRDLEAVEAAVEEIEESSDVDAAGFVAEYFGPDRRRDEGCSDADWVRLRLRLWRLTGGLEHLEAAERALFNAFYANQFSNGDFGHVVLDRGGLDYGGARAWWCCTLHGLRALSAVAETAFRADGGALFWDLPIDSAGSVGGLRVRAEARLETERAATLRVEAADGTAAAIAVRLPRWAAEARFALNGRPIAGESGAGYARFARSWKPGDELYIEYALARRVENDPTASGYSLVLDGPWLLGVAEAESPDFFDEPAERNRVDLDGIEQNALPYSPGGYPEQTASARLSRLADRGALDRLQRRRFRFLTDEGAARRARLVQRVERSAADWTPAFLTGVCLGAAGVALFAFIRRRQATR